jgi:Protein of unknown function (DUF1573)
MHKPDALRLCSLSLARDAIICAAAFFGCAPNRADQDSSRSYPKNPVGPSVADSLTVSPNLIVLGDLPAGHCAGATVVLTNGDDEPVDVKRIESSCPCLSTSPASLRVEARGKAALRVEFDPRSEPDFHGKLMIYLTGFDAAGGTAFRCRAYISVSF